MSKFAFANKPKYTELYCSSCKKAVSKLTVKLKFSTTEHVFCDIDCKNKFSFSHPSKGKSKIGERLLSYYATRKDANRYNAIRENAKIIARDLPRKCCICSYDKHVEVCHRKAISKFPLNTPVKVINHITNLALLCRNHHWEFDNNLIVIPMHLVGVEPTTVS
jgi:hypothetical protein